MDKLVLKQTDIGRSVFANRNFKKMEEIIEFQGGLLTYEQLPRPYNEDLYVQIGENLYMGPSGKLDDFINHSCNPNSGLRVDGRKAVLIAIKLIKKGAEITWDYSTTMNEGDWEMDCACQSRKCRGRIRDFKYLPESIQRKYFELGVVPRYIVESLNLS